MSLNLEDIFIHSANMPGLFVPLNLSVKPGQIGVVMGPSGVGKSTLLDAVAGHLSPVFTLEGRITLNTTDLRPLPPEMRHVGMMFQDAILFPHLSVGDNLAFGLSSGVKGYSVRRAVVEEALKQAGLGGLYARDPASLSGGQRARAALMRTLLAQPQALLLDEPFSKLDTEQRNEIRCFTFAHIRERGIPALLVTHDPEDAEAAGGPIVNLNA